MASVVMVVGSVKEIPGAMLDIIGNDLKGGGSSIVLVCDIPLIARSSMGCDVLATSRVLAAPRKI